MTTALLIILTAAYAAGVWCLNRRLDQLHSRQLGEFRKGGRRDQA